MGQGAASSPALQQRRSREERGTVALPGKRKGGGPGVGLFCKIGGAGGGMWRRAAAQHLFESGALHHAAGGGRRRRRRRLLRGSWRGGVAACCRGGFRPGRSGGARRRRRAALVGLRWPDGIGGGARRRVGCIGGRIGGSPEAPVGGQCYGGGLGQWRDGDCGKYCKTVTCKADSGGRPNTWRVEQICTPF